MRQHVVHEVTDGDAAEKLHRFRPDQHGDTDDLQHATRVRKERGELVDLVPTLRPVPPKTPLREVGALGFIPGDVLHGGGARGLIDHVRSQLAEIRDLARREAEISERLGEPVKIAFDPNSGHTVVLTRADADYARVRSAAEVYDRVKFDLQKMGLSLADFRDLLQA